MPTDSTDARKINRGEGAGGCPVTRNADGVWLVRDCTAARVALRSSDTVQAGLGVETLDNLPARIRRPVLYRDGPEHREHRRQTARFFTPRRVDESYRGFIDSLADRQLAANCSPCPVSACPPRPGSVPTTQSAATPSET